MANKTNKGIKAKAVTTATANAQTPTGTGVQWLNGLDPNVAGLYNGAQQIMQDNGAVSAYQQARDNGLQQANRQYNDNARNYYQMYKQNQSRLGENLSRLGINGGASETAATSLLNNYSGNIYNNSQAKANAINDINMQYDQLIAKNSAEIAGQLANMYYNLGNGLLTERRQNERDDFIRNQTWKREDYLRKEGYKREDADKAYDRALAQAQYTGDFSAMKQFGWSKSDIKKANNIFASNNSTGGGGRSGGGGGYRYGGYGSSGGGIFDLGGTDDGSNDSPDSPSKDGGGNSGTSASKQGDRLKDTASEKAYLKKSRRNGSTSTGSNATYNALYANLGSAKTVGELKAAWTRVNNTSGGITEAQRNKLYQLYVSRRKKVSNGPSKDTGGGKKTNAGGGSNKQQYK